MTAGHRQLINRLFPFVVRKPLEHAFIIVSPMLPFVRTLIYRHLTKRLRQKNAKDRKERGREKEKEGEKFDKLDGRIDKKKRRRALECLPCDEIKRGLYATITDRR